MFSRKKDAGKISDTTPVFHVRYIGCTETYVASGRGCSYKPVQRLWDNSPGEKHLRKVSGGGGWLGGGLDWLIGCFVLM